MKLQFLGTGSAEGVPSAFCRCASCEHARRNKGKDIRRRASVLINDEVLIDLGPDLFNVGYRLGISFGHVRWALQTHPHTDHLDALTFFSRDEGTLVEGLEPMTWFVNGSGVRRMDLITNNGREAFLSEASQRRHTMSIELIEPWQAFEFGRYRVQTVAANHDDGARAMLFAIEDTADGSRVFYGTDTGPLPLETWSRLAELGWTFDVFILDHNNGWGKRGERHHNADQFLEDVQAARDAGVIVDGTQVIAHHIAHHGHPPHEAFVEKAAGFGYEPAWDGLIVDTVPAS